MDATLLWLALAGLFAGFIDSIIGGGGVITLPALLASGLPPHAAVATNKVVGTGASSIATVNYARAGLITAVAWRLWIPVAVVSAMGAALVLRIDGRYLIWAVLAVILILAVYVIAAPNFGRVAKIRAGIGAPLALTAGALLIGLYDGFLGPGTGNMLLVLFVLASGLPLLQAAAHSRAINFASNVGALLFWLTTGLIDWRLGLAAAVGTMTGSWLGSRSNIRSEAKWVRPLFVAVAAALLIRLVWTLG